jgi:type III secretion system YscD/HrpQ family protein
LLYNLGTLKFIKNIDDDDIVIDEGVWNEINSLLSSKPEWKGISVYSPAAGQFILSGELETRKQAEQLSSYLHLNFPYLDLLKKQIVVEEDIVNKIQDWLHNAQLFDVTSKIHNGEVSLNGFIPPDRSNEFNEIIGKIKQIPGVRIVNNLVRSQTVEKGITDLSDHYQVNGESRIGNKFTVVINGHILSEGDDLDGMTITQITDDRISLEKDGEKFRIDY